MTTRRSILKRLAGAVAVAFTGLVGAVERAKGDVNPPFVARNGEWVVEPRLTSRLVTVEGIGDPIPYLISPGEHLFVSHRNGVGEASVRGVNGVVRLLGHARLSPGRFPSIRWHERS